MPCNYRDYHSDWKSISRQIKDQAGDRCEFCGVPNYGAQDSVDRQGFRAGRSVRIVLTVAHLCHDPSCYDPTHLRALCQACHLRYDAKHHAKNAAETRRRKRVEAGQGVMV